MLFNFYIVFKSYIELNAESKENVINYDNLINLCIMVKNGGEQFESMLKENLHLIDRWTILDTGSTDNTIDIINRVLVGTKKGKLYKEPFINFRDSRNRLLELAGQTCKYILMLDDTYRIKGDLRHFLNEVRSDQFSDSFSLYIKSDDVEYVSNRILKSNRKLKYIYRIHEVIQEENNINVTVPIEKCHVLDERYDYMEKRTMDRKLLDIKLLFEEMVEDPNNVRTYYYLGQTYNIIEDYENAFKWFMERVNHPKVGFLQEKVDACFEAARIANFKLNKSWTEVELLYNKAYELDKERPDALYFIGIHHYLNNNIGLAYEHFKQAYEIGYPSHRQYSLKPTLSYYFLPKYLVRTCYQLEDYKLGRDCCEYFFKHNHEENVKMDKNKDINDYIEMQSWWSIFNNLNLCKKNNFPIKSEKEIICFVADGGYEPWSGSSILTKGVGGSETYIIEMSRYIKKNSNYNVIVFCNCVEPETFEGVEYLPLNEYHEFVNTYYVNTCIVSRFTQYLPVAFKSYVENVYLVLHDINSIGNVIPIDPKLRRIFCLTEWHCDIVSNNFPLLNHLIEPLYYGIDVNTFNHKNNNKIPYKFIYSSFPNRGLLPLLQMWPKLYQIQPLVSLDIFCDVNGKWVNEMEPVVMMEIKQLLKIYKKHPQNYNIKYHGWVDKKTLANAWLESDIWFYPCVFSETFCLTALEAAITKTFVITNGLSALKYTVGDRGIVIEGNPNEKEWQERAINILKVYILNNSIDHYNYKNELIEKNYNWSKTLTWNNQSLKLLQLLNTYNIKNDNIHHDNEYFKNDELNVKLDYCGMYNWTNDLPRNHKKYFIDVIKYFNNKRKLLNLDNNKNNIIENECEKSKENAKIKVLEIGVYTGTSLINIVKLIPNSIGYAVDAWENYKETDLSEKIVENNIEQIFYKNIEIAGLSLDKDIKCVKGKSLDILMEFYKNQTTFDFIYVDGSHLLLDAYIDIILSWKLLNKGGILAIDDVYYNQDKKNQLLSPLKAVEHFMNQYNGQFKILHIEYRAFFEKI
jgi:predicted O-methyltransferase YrrM